FLQARIYTGQHHRLVLTAGRQRGPRRECGGSESADRDLEKTASPEGGVEQSGTAGGGGMGDNRNLQLLLHGLLRLFCIVGPAALGMWGSASDVHQSKARPGVASVGMSCCRYMVVS